MKNQTLRVSPSEKKGKFQAGLQPAAVNNTTGPTDQPDFHGKTKLAMLKLSKNGVGRHKKKKKGYRVD